MQQKQRPKQKHQTGRWALWRIVSLECTFRLQLSEWGKMAQRAWQRTGLMIPSHQCPQLALPGHKETAFRVIGHTKGSEVRTKPIGTLRLVILFPSRLMARPAGYNTA